MTKQFWKAPNPSRLGKLATAMAAQGVSSLANILIFVLVAREAGPQGLGEFSICFTVMLFLVSMQTAWVGDAYIVLDHHDPRIRSGIHGTQLIHMLGGAGVAGPLVYFVFDLGLSSAIALSVLVVTWQAEEYGRRVFMAHRRFIAQAVSDLVYLTVAVGLLVLLSGIVTVTVTRSLEIVAVASSLAFVFNQLLAGPESRLRFPRIEWTNLVEVGRFGLWRGAQSGLGYLVQVLLRFVVVAIGSVAALGTLEAARMASAPLFTVLAAAGNVMLPLFATAGAQPPGALKRRVFTASVILALGVVAYGMVATVWAGPITRALVGGAFEPNQFMVGGWCLLGLAIAVTSPGFAAATMSTPSRQLFLLRSLGQVTGLLASIGLGVRYGIGWIPIGQAAGILSGGLAVWWASRMRASAQAGVEWNVKPRE